MAVEEDSRQSSPRCSNSRQRGRVGKNYGECGSRGYRVGLRADDGTSVGGAEALLAGVLSLARREVALGVKRLEGLAQHALRCCVVGTWAVLAKPSRKDQCRPRQSQTSSPPRR